MNKPIGAKIEDWYCENCALAILVAFVIAWVGLIVTTTAASVVVAWLLWDSAKILTAVASESSGLREIMGALILMSLPPAMYLTWIAKNIIKFEISVREFSS